ncbi:MAG: LuxR C-terminal-related transcriptional regulator [Flavobacteriaceae bacterium]
MQLQHIQNKLTKTEYDIFQFIQKGKLSKEIAIERNCSERTIEKHRSNIITKLNLSKKTNSLTNWILKNKNTP